MTARSSGNAEDFVAFAHEITSIFARLSEALGLSVDRSQYSASRARRVLSHWAYNLDLH
jgi:hypothetical protein